MAERDLEDELRMDNIEKLEMNGLEKLGKSVAGSEQRAEQLAQRALAALGFRVVHESWGIYIETADGKYDVFFEGLPAFSTSSFSSTWSSILGKIVACREFGMDTREDRVPDGKEDSSSSAIKWTSNPLFGCRSREELELKLAIRGCAV